ncbi:MAG: GNAT family N-acetyltransferase [Acidimicrobiia bacterium]
MSLEIGSADLSVVLPFRQSLLRPMQTVDACVFDGDEALDADHLVARLGGEVVGIASVVPSARPGGAADGRRIRMVGVVPTHRGEGIGVELTAACVGRAVVRGASETWLSSRSHLVGWYRAMGFDVVGPEYDKPPVGPHVDLALPLSPGPSGP